MRVYIEYVLIDNFLIDYTLLKAAFALTKTHASGARLFFASLFGAVFALFYPMIESVTAVAVPYKIATGLFVVLIAAKTFTFRSYYINVLAFFLFTFLTGGALIGIFSLLKIPLSGEVFIALIFVPVYFIIKGTTVIIKYFYRKKSVDGFIYRAEVKNGKTIEKVKGFLDSGNTMFRDGQPVIFCVKSLAKKLVYGAPLNTEIKRLTVKTVAGESRKTAFVLEQLKIYIKDEPNIFKNVIVCVADDGAFNGYELILHPALMEVSNDCERGVKVKKVS